MNEPPPLTFLWRWLGRGIIVCGCKRIFVHSSCFEMKRNFPAFYEWNPGLCYREHYGQNGQMDMVQKCYQRNGSIQLWTEITKLESFKNFYLEAFSVLTIDKVKAQKWPILLIFLPGRYWVLGLKILFVAEIEKLLPARQPLTTSAGSWTPGLGKISKGFYTENYFPLMVNWLFFFHIRFVEVAASYFLRYFLNLKQLLVCGDQAQSLKRLQ